MSVSSMYDFEIIAGSYEEFLLGYLCSIEDGKVKQSFASHDHTGSVRALASSGKYLASGATDDRIIIYDLETRKECNMLVHHEATITSLQFTHDQSHLISSSSDGVLAITRVGNWTLEKKWNEAHKGASILDIAIHESDKLALTLGADLTLRTWNLIKGRQAYAINLKTKSKDAKSLEKILWNTDGTEFMLFGGKFVEIWSIEEGRMKKFFEFQERVTSCVWINSKKIAVGNEIGEISLIELKTDNTTCTKKIHEFRVKCLKIHENFLISICSNGEMKLLSLKLKELLKENTGCRLTCLSIVPTKKIKKEEIDEVNDEKVVEKSGTQINTNMKSHVTVVQENSDDEVVVKEQKSKKKKRKIK